MQTKAFEIIALSAQVKTLIHQLHLTNIFNHWLYVLESFSASNFMFFFCDSLISNFSAMSDCYNCSTSYADWLTLPWKGIRAFFDDGQHQRPLQDKQFSDMSR